MTIVRHASLEDAPHVSRLVDALLIELGAFPSKDDERLRATTHLLKLQGRVFSFLAFEQKEPIAVIMISETGAIYAGGLFGVITELYVVPERRASGVGKMLIGAAASLGQERSWSRIEVTAPRQPAWERTLEFYLRAGFAETGPRLRLLL